MSDVATPTGGDNMTAGRLLRQAREAAGMHVASLAVSLKVPVRKLEALEEDRYDELPDAVFIRALASSVCRTLKIDPNPVLERLPQTTTPRLLQQNDGINTPFRPSGEARTTKATEHVSKPVVVTVFALLLGALVLIFLPRGQEQVAGGGGAARPAPAASGAVSGAPAQSATPTDPASAQPAAAGSAPSSDAVATPPAASPGVATNPAAPAPLAVAAAPGPSNASTASVPPAASPAVPGASAAAAPAVVASAAANAASGTVVFRTRAPSWVSVTDAKGTAVLRRLLQAGETVGVSGALPMAVTVGSAQATEVQVRGQPFDIAPLSRDNVARFEVK